MRIDPAIAALREASFSQRLPSQTSAAQIGSAALRKRHDDWLDRARTRRVLEELERYAAQDPIESCPALARLLSSRSDARAFVDPILWETLCALSQHSLGETPFRYRISQGYATIQLAARAGAALSLVAYEPLPHGKAPSTALFSDCEAHELVLEGAASGVKHFWHSQGGIASVAQTWGSSNRITVKARTQARDVVHVESAFLLLRLTREAKRPAPTRQLCLETGQTLHTASGDKSASQAVMALSVLGALQDDGALDVMGSTALNRDEDPDVRWEAVRQTLALAPVRGLSLLTRLEARLSDPLSNPAASLRTTLLDRQPELRALILREAA